MTPRIEPFFDATTSTFTYVIYEAPGSRCAIVDSVLDYDPHSGRTATRSADRVAGFVRKQGLTVEWLLETHAHADHLSAAPYLRRQLGGRIAIGEGIRRVQGAFKDVFNLEPDFRLDGSQFDHLFQPDERFHIGALSARALHVPGHTPADMAYQVEEEHVFVGDTLFMPDVGSARCDFPGGSARDLYRSIRRLLTLPDATRLYLCHDYPPTGREPRHDTTVGEERALNVHVRDGVDEDTFVSLRTRRDATLAMPTLILPAIQVNIRAGTLPPVEANGRRYLKIPIDGF